MFGKKTGKPQNQIDSLIGADTHIDGNINFSGGLRVDGHVRGNIIASSDKLSTLVLSDEAIIEGKIQVSHAIINGTVIGAIQTSEYVELQAKAKVSGDVQYKTLEIHVGASVQGMLLHRDRDDIQPGNKVVPLIPAAHGD
ncbi:bactofilin family protein [Nitrosovibrio tenuis]|uniref:Protein CcmA, bactofilin family n=1 Tax=Nitrosovibrio tenuis TaxID=1233 RepID=A0A1H7NAP3_9PROT|nr:polymer-forming cytoskeletal protein [Nitrosovibrio tenuis]SEL20381.1 protein CcmA, bactofilin family [Nitrosovibrio tenuis]